MQYGVTLPYLDASTVADLAHEVEAAGWDGLFVWDGITGPDPWVCLTAAAMRTERIRLGTMLTPVSRRRPWKLAQESATLDHLSRGRLILPVALGAPDTGFARFNEATDRKLRAQLLDEGLDVLMGLWSATPFSYNGQHYHIDEATGDRPLQSPRIPIWVVGAWPRMKSMRRALRCDGVLAVKMNDDGSFGDMTPDDMQAMQAYIAEQRTAATPFDIIIEGETPGDNREQALAIVGPRAASGFTWWLENVWATPMTQGGVEGIRTRIRQGPPRCEE